MRLWLGKLDGRFSQSPAIQYLRDHVSVDHGVPRSDPAVFAGNVPDGPRVLQNPDELSSPKKEMNLGLANLGTMVNECYRRIAWLP